MERTWDVIVIGAGLAGLTAAAAARAGGASTLVLEAHQPGGRAQVSEKHGFVFNRGGHALYRGGPGSEVLRSLGVAADGAPPPLRVYHLGGAARSGVLPTDFPTLARTPMLSWRSKVRLARLLASLGRIKTSGLVGRSMEDWVQNLDLAPDAEGVLRALIRIGTYSSDMAELGADAGVAQLQLGVTSGVVYLHGGWRPLLEALAAGLRVDTGQPVRAVRAGDRHVEVHVGEGVVVGRAAVLAAGGPEVSRRLLDNAPDWGDLGGPVTAACLDTAVRVPPSPGYLLGLDEPLYTTTQSPPARQAPAGAAVVASLRYGVRSAAQDRADLEAHRQAAGVGADAIIHERFLARMTVTATSPRPSLGGLVGRPAVGATGTAGVFLAGDWIGHRGLLADASLASGYEAGRAALDRAGRVGRWPARLVG